MSVTRRFSRRRDGSLRLKVVATGQHHEELSRLWGGMRCDRSDGLGWRTEVTIDLPPHGASPTEPGADHLLRSRGFAEFLDTLTTAGGDWAELAAGVCADSERLSTSWVPPEERDQAPVVGDAALRAMVRARPHPVLALVVDELGIHNGHVRADVAVLADDAWAGVEIKGERDTLTRLPRQVEAYSAVFDRCELVLTAGHAQAAGALLPPWWALTVSDGSTMTVVRAGDLNPAPDARARAQLLWRDEAMAELKRLGAARGLSAKARDYLWDALADQHDAASLRTVVTAAMRSRSGWLTDGGRTRTPMTA